MIVILESSQYHESCKWKIRQTSLASRRDKAMSKKQYEAELSELATLLEETVNEQTAMKKRFVFFVMPLSIIKKLSLYLIIRV